MGFLPQNPVKTVDKIFRFCYYISANKQNSVLTAAKGRSVAALNKTDLVCLLPTEFMPSANFFRRETTIKELQINEQIRDRELRVISANGDQLGILSAQEANRMAEEQGLDLVKISPTAVPPVCKIMDYGKFKYEQTKREKDAKKNQKIVELKEVWLSATIDVGDLNIKAKQAIKFVQNGDKVRVSIRLKGRQQAYPEIAMGIMHDFFEIVRPYAVKEKEPKLEGRTIAMNIAPIPQKNK